MDLCERWRLELDRLREEGRHRSLAPPAGIDFSSNDYLGYSKRRWPASDLSRSGSASRLLRGQHPVWDDVEAALADWHRAEAALVFTSGYAANEGLLSTIAAAGDTVFSDQHNHASIIDGLRLSRAERVIFPHNDHRRLHALMSERRPGRRGHEAWFIVTESLFGMEADRAPLHRLAALADDFDAHLIVDEAHATGCFGLAGGGLVDEMGLRRPVFATVHTGGKALAVPGAYVAGSRLLKEMLINRSRHFIFTTALAPQIGAWWLDTIALAKVDDAARHTLRQRAEEFRRQLESRGIAVLGADQIATIILGDDRLAVQAAQELRSAGYDIRAIRPPTVPPGTARLRIAIHADHEVGVLRDLAHVLASIVPPSP